MKKAKKEGRIEKLNEEEEKKEEQQQLQRVMVG